ncbi:MAG: dihydrodipicolinate synthase family protein [Thermoplasmatales archaeon]
MNVLCSKSMKGVFPAVPTVFDKNGNIQLDDVGNLLEFAKGSKADGAWLHVIGGEYYKLELEERKKIIIKSVDLAPQNLPIYVNASSQSLNSSMNIIKLCEQIGVKGIILNSPFFSPLKGEIEANYKTTRELISKTLLPIIIQIYTDGSDHGNKYLDFALSRQNVKAVKLEGPGYMELSKKIMRKNEHLSILGGMYSIELYQEMKSGFSGTVPGVSIAKRVKEAMTSYERHNMKKFKSCIERLHKVQQMFINNFNSFPYLERLALYKMGVIGTIGYRMPAVIPSSGVLKKFENAIEEFLEASC